MGKDSLNISASPSRFPLQEYEKQDAVFGHAFEVLRQAIEQRTFPCASVAITNCGNLVALKALGRFSYANDAPQVSTASIFDIASVSKVVATTSMAMILYERGLLDLEAPVAGVLPEFVGKDAIRREITFRMLLAHSTGLPAYEGLFQRTSTKDLLLRAALEVPLKNPPGTHTEYSDIGFILLGAAL